MNDVWKAHIFPSLSPIDLARLGQCSRSLAALLNKNEVLNDWKVKMTSPITSETVYHAGRTGHVDVLSLLYTVLCLKGSS